MKWYLLSLSVMGVAASFAADPPTVQIVTPGPAPIQAGGAATQFQIMIANDLAGDLPKVASFSLNGVACAAATCGSFGAIAGTAGSGSYTVMYTPPASLAVTISP